MNKSDRFLKCPRCGVDLESSSGIVCPACSLVLRDNFDEGKDAIEEKRLANIRFHQLGSLCWFFGPPIVAVVAAIFRLEAWAAISFYISPFSGAAAGIQLGIYLHQKFGYSRWYCLVYALIGAFVCLMLTFGGCFVASQIS